MTSYVRINFSSGLSFFLLRPYYSDFADRLIKDHVALTVISGWNYLWSSRYLLKG